MWSVLQEEESANETGCELYVNRVLITNHRRLILDQRVSPHTACARIVEIISGQSVSAHDTLGIYRDIFEDQCYRRHGVSVRDGDCVLDVGANTGLFVLYLNTLSA